MQTWADTTGVQQPVNGDRPYGNFWVEIDSAPDIFCAFNYAQWTWVPITNRLIDAQIAQSEYAVPITARALREFMFLALAAFRIDPLAKDGQNNYVQPKFAAIALLDQKIQALRSQRK